MQTLMPTTDLTGPGAASSSTSAFNPAAGELSWPAFAFSVATGWDDSGVVTPVSSFSPEVSIEVSEGMEDGIRGESWVLDIASARGREKNQSRNIIHMR